MSQRYLDSIRNPVPYPASDTERSNPPSRARTPVSGVENPSSRAYPRGNTTPGQSNPPSRARTPASVLELTNPKPYPKAQYAYDNPVVKPTAVKASPEKQAKPYQQRDADKPKAKRLTKTRSTPRSGSNPSTPTPSDGEYVSGQHINGSYKGGSITSLDLELQVVAGNPIKKETNIDVEAGPTPARRTTSIDGKAPRYDEVGEKKKEKEALGGKEPPVIDTTKSSHPMTSRERKEKQLKAARDEEDDDEEEVWYKRHEKLLWLVFFLVVIFFALGLGLALGGVGYPADAFARTLGQACRFPCRDRAKYTKRSHNPLIVLAIDGLPNDVLHDDHTIAQNIRRMSDCGVHSHDMIPSFASTTYPNLWSILTGRYPESHGIISDFMRGSIGRVFEPRVSQDDLQATEWYKAKPLWQTAREQGVITASHSWLGNNVLSDDNSYGQTINGRPNYYQSYNSQLTPQDKIDTVLKWIQQEDVEKIPQFITVFFDELGNAVRSYGHNSLQANDTLRMIDQAIGSMMDYLFRNQDSYCFNFIVMSTTGLVATTCGFNNDNVEFLSDQVASYSTGFEVTPNYLNAFARISVSAQADDNIDTQWELSNFLKCKFPASGSVYTRVELPSRYHYSSDAVPDDVYVLMKEGKSFGLESFNYDQSNCQYASDGYDPTGVDATAVFVGFGRDFKVDHGFDEFSNVEVYNLMSKLLGITPEPNNGTMGALYDMLTSPGGFPNAPMEVAQESTCSFSNRPMGDYKTGCTCPASQGLPEATERGAAVFSNSGSTAAFHAPFGVPNLLASTSPDSESTCVLYQSSYLTRYDTSLTIAKYVSFTLEPGYTQVTMPTNCILTDTRLEIGENPSCSAYTDPIESLQLAVNIKRSFLLQPELSVGNADAGIITSNIVPLYSKFETDIWNRLMNTYRSWSNLAGVRNLNIVQGPVYDLNHDGVADDFSLISSSYSWAGQTVIPSHYFVVASRCYNSTIEQCQPHEIQTMAFILPHNNMGLPCQSTSFDDYLLDNRASVQDVERITGLCFFPDWSLSNDENEREAITVVKTHLPHMFWQN